MLNLNGKINGGIYMDIAVQKVEYIDINDLSVQLEYSVARNKVEKKELLKILLVNSDSSINFISSANKLLKSMKKDGIIKLFVFESDLNNLEKMETIYLLNKFPELSFTNDSSETTIYIKI